MSLAKLLGRAAEVARPQLQPGVELKLQMPSESVHVLVDGTVITQVMINLLSNASKHTRGGTVLLACAPLGGDSYRFSVTDTGSGLSPEIKSCLFDRYRTIGGVGLGLHITYLQVKAMGSTIRVVSPVQSDAPTGQLGSEFSFELELPQAEAPPPQTEDAVEATGGTVQTPPLLPEGLKILIADDAKTNRKLLRAAFERHCSASWSVSEACSGEEAVQLCEEERFDLVVMDEVFSESQVRQDGPDVPMRGSEAIAQIRRGEASRGEARPSRIISCSGHSFKGGLGPAAPPGADQVWQKPFPDFTNGNMQRALSELFAARPVGGERHRFA